MKLWNKENWYAIKHNMYEIIDVYLKDDKEDYLIGSWDISRKEYISLKLVDIPIGHILNEICLFFKDIKERI